MDINALHVDVLVWQEGEQCGIPWATLVTRPPQHTLVVERMHSGARRYIVLDFGHLVRLTDLVSLTVHTALDSRSFLRI